MLSPSGTIIPPAGQVTQVLKVTNIHKVSTVDVNLLIIVKFDIQFNENWL